MKRTFIKMQVCGNDYLIFGADFSPAYGLFSAVKRLCDRRFGVGADGVVLLSAASGADGEMRMFNADGSEGKMCGSALCMAASVLSARLKKSYLKIRTASGVRRARVVRDRNGVFVRAQMGRAAFAPESLPVCLPEMGGGVFLRDVDAGGKTVKISCVSMGNPHAVTFVEQGEIADVAALGSALEKSPLFPEGANAEFVRVRSRREIFVRVWERGSGETLCCCTGACAAVAVGVRLGILDGGKDVCVQYKGGAVAVKCGARGLTLTARPKECFRGEVEI